MNADEILKALFPHEETIKRLQAEIETLTARIKELENERTRTNDDRRTADSTPAKTTQSATRQAKKADTPS